MERSLAVQWLNRWCASPHTRIRCVSLSGSLYLWRMLARAFIALALLALSPGLAAASVTWGPPEPVSAPFAYSAHVWMDARGNAFAMWEQQGPETPHVSTLNYAWRPAQRPWRSSQVLGDGRSPRPGDAAALSPGGVATVLRVDGGRVLRVYRASVGDSFREVAHFDIEGYGGDAQVAVDDEGNALVAWMETRAGGPEVVRAAFVRRDGSATRAQDLGRGDFLQLAMNAAGAAVVGWVDPTGGPFAAYRPPAGHFGAGRPVPLGSPAVLWAAVDARGIALLAATQHAGPGTGTHVPGTSYVLAGPEGAFGPARELAHDGFPVQLLAEPGGAVDLLSQTGNTAGSGGLEFYSRLASGAHVGPIPLGGPQACPGHLATSTGSDLLASMVAVCRGPDGNHIGVRIREDGVWGAPELPIGANGSHPIGAIADGGEAVVLYNGYPSRRVEAVVREDPRRLLPPLPVVALDLPKVARLGRNGRINIKVRCRQRCRVRPVGLLHAGEKVVPVRGSAERHRGGVKETTRLSFGRGAAAAVGQAGAAAWASVSVIVEGRSPRPLTVTRRLSLTP